MRRWVVVLLAALVLPVIPVDANQEPFNFYIEDEIIAHPGETVQVRIAWQNIVGTERHFSVSVNTMGANISVSDLPTDWTRVASCLLYTSPSPRDGLLSRMPSSA